MEERSMKRVAAICLALLLMCADAMALTLRNFNEYAMDVDEALAEIYIHPLHEEPNCINSRPALPSARRTASQSFPARHRTRNIIRPSAYMEATAGFATVTRSPNRKSGEWTRSFLSGMTCAHTFRYSTPCSYWARKGRA